MTTVEDAISRLLEQYVAATNAGDVEAYMAILADDVVVLPPDHPPLRGRDAAGTWVKENFFDLFTVKLECKFERIVVAGSEAFAPGTFTLEVKPKAGGDPMRTTGEFFNIFREEAPGSWKYTYEIHNFDQPLA
jgi:ketosteroid isomerase-like protein